MLPQYMQWPCVRLSVYPSVCLLQAAISVLLSLMYSFRRAGVYPIVSLCYVVTPVDTVTALLLA